MTWNRYKSLRKLIGVFRILSKVDLFTAPISKPVTAGLGQDTDPASSCGQLQSEAGPVLNRIKLPNH